MSERVVASNISTETEDLLDRIKQEHLMIYETASTFIPEGEECDCGVNGEIDTVSLPLVTMTKDCQI